MRFNFRTQVANENVEVFYWSGGRTEVGGEGKRIKTKIINQSDSKPKYLIQTTAARYSVAIKVNTSNTKQNIGKSLSNNISVCVQKEPKISDKIPPSAIPGGGRNIHINDAEWP